MFRSFTLYPTRYFLALCLLTVQAAAYLTITEPTHNTKWKNNAVNTIKWQKGTLDGVDSFDIEFTRMTVDGNLFVAKSVSSSQSSLNIMLQDVPAGDDYYVLFINHTHGVIDALSPRFTVLDSSSNFVGQAPIQGSPTVTVSGSPNPTQEFPTTFPARVGVSNSATGAQGEIWKMQLAAVGAAIATSFVAIGSWTVL